MKKLLKFVLLFSILSSLLVAGTSIKAQEANNVSMAFNTVFRYSLSSNDFSNEAVDGHQIWGTSLDNSPDGTQEVVASPNVYLALNNDVSYAAMIPEPDMINPPDYSWNLLDIDENSSEEVIVIRSGPVSFTPGFNISREVIPPNFTVDGDQIVKIHLERVGPVDEFHINVDLPPQPPPLTSVFDTTYLLPVNSPENIIYYSNSNRALNIIIPDPENDMDGKWDYEFKINVNVEEGAADYMPSVLVENKTFLSHQLSDGSSISYAFPGLGEWTWESTGDFSWSTTAFENRQVALEGFIGPNRVSVLFNNSSEYITPGNDFVDGDILGNSSWVSNIINIFDASHLPVTDLAVDLDNDLDLKTCHWYYENIPEASPPPPLPFPREVGRAAQYGTNRFMPGFDISRSIDPLILNDDGVQTLTLTVKPEETAPLIIMINVQEDNVLSADITSPSTTPPTPTPPVQPVYVNNGKNLRISIPDAAAGNTYTFNVTIQIDLQDGVLSAIHMPMINVSKGEQIPISEFYGSGMSHSIDGLGIWNLKASGKYSWEWADVSRKSVTMAGYSGNMTGSVTGGGWIISPPGAYYEDPTLTGKAAFDFNAKYLNGDSIPTGTFSFELADGFVFTSDAMQRLSVEYNNIDLMGEGTINGTGICGFRMMANDGKRDDTIKVVIWEKTTGVIVYNNHLGFPDSAPGQIIDGGTIQIHDMENSGHPVRPLPNLNDFQKGMNFVDGRPVDSPEYGLYTPPKTDQSLENLAATGANWIALEVRGCQRTIDTTDIFTDSPTTATDEELRRVIDLAHALGMRVMLKPRVFITEERSGSVEIGINFNEEEWQAWFASYQKFILQYADLAKDAGADMFCIGDELSSTVHREADWRHIAQEVRKSYKGPIIYEATSDEDPLPSEDMRINWWDAVDYIGVLGYFPLTQKNDPSVDELKSAWMGHIPHFEALSQRFQKPIVISEIGYDSCNGTNKHPASAETPEVDLQEQADCYEAAFEVLLGQPWLKGIFWWIWDADPDEGGPNNNSRTPQNKPAEEVLKSYFLSQ